MDIQEYIAVCIAFLCGCVVVKEFVQPFWQKNGCGGCSGCAPPVNDTLQIAPPKR